MSETKGDQSPKIRAKIRKAYDNPYDSLSVSAFRSQDRHFATRILLGVVGAALVVAGVLSLPDVRQTLIHLGEPPGGQASSSGPNPEPTPMPLHNPMVAPDSN